LEIELLFEAGGRVKLMAKCLQKETFTRVRALFRKRLAADTRGQELMEFALVLPAVMMLLMGIFYLGRAISVYEALGRAAHEGARAVLATSCATCGNAVNYGAATTPINNALLAASLDPSQATVSSPSAIVPLNPGDPTNYQVNGVTVQIQYPVQLNIPFTSLNATTITLSQTVTMRQEF
jgi:Flp pilus assembly protein TadG